MNIDFYPRKNEIKLIMFGNQSRRREIYRVINTSDMSENVKLSNGETVFILGFIFGQTENFGMSSFPEKDRSIFTKLADARINQLSCAIRFNNSEFLILLGFLKKNMPLKKINGVYLNGSKFL